MSADKGTFGAANMELFDEERQQQRNDVSTPAALEPADPTRSALTGDRPCRRGAPSPRVRSVGHACSVVYVIFVWISGLSTVLPNIRLFMLGGCL